MGEEKIYTCPMHPDVRQDEPGRCPKCGMDLVAAAPRGKDAVLMKKAKEDKGCHCC